MTISRALLLIPLAYLLPGLALFLIFWWFIHKAFVRNHEMLFEERPPLNFHEIEAIRDRDVS